MAAADAEEEEEALRRNLRLLAKNADKPAAERRQQRVHQAIQRKWSDWSECSANCLRTRHRLDCNDLLNESQPVKITRKLRAAAADLFRPKRLTTATTTGRATPKESADEETWLANNSAVERDKKSHGRAPFASGAKSGLGDQLDEEDYADEGDDDEEDPCDKVDSRRTYEEQVCTGGQCRLVPSPLADGAQFSRISTAHKPSRNLSRSYKQPHQPKTGKFL